MTLKDKVALVTGAGQGIGRGIALTLAKEGSAVIVSDLDQKSGEAVAAEIESAGGRSLFLAADVSSRSAVEKLFKDSVERFGRLDILVNNAGIYPFVSFSAMTEEDWDRVISVNLKSVFLCSKEAFKIMPEGGRIICVSSVAAFVGFEGLAHYCASKGGINGLVRALALELASKKITVNAVAPGIIETPGVQDSEEVKKQTIAAIPLARLGQPQDIASAVIFFAQPSTDYATGQILIVDGGWTLR